jgi:alpha-L-fucosidase 2
MLLQSHDGLLNVLPARPDAWDSGEITGLKARGGYNVDIQWKQGKLTKLVVRSELGGVCRLRLPNSLVLAGNKSLKPAVGTNPNPFFKLPENQFQTSTPETVIGAVQVYDLPTEAGKTYVLVTESGRSQREKKR